MAAMINVLFWVVIFTKCFLPTRNLTLGAKAEVASGKYVTNLEKETKTGLVQLLNGAKKQPV